MLNKANIIFKEAIMSKKGKEFKSSFFARNPQFNYVPESDQYLFLLDKPKYKFNVIGCGIMGQEHMRITMLEGRGGIHGIYDTAPLSLEKAEQMFSLYFPGNQLVKYDSLEAACNDPAVDGLIICTPNFTHIDVIRVAAQSGKHILLEKPMATTIKDAYEIMQIAKKYKSVFQVGLQYRFKAVYVEAIHEALERKSIGDIKMISMLEHRVPFLDKVKQWNKFSKFSGGTLVEKCCHYFDLMNLLAQSKPSSVYATGSMAVNFKTFEYNNEKSDILDNAFVTVKYDNNVLSNFSLCMFSPMFHEEMIICGEEGRLMTVENEDFLPAERPKTHLEIMRGEGKPSRVTTPCYPSYIEMTGHNGATFFEHVYFIDNLEGKKTNTATVEDGFWSIVVGYAAEESVRTGKIIIIDELLKLNGINAK